MSRETLEAALTTFTGEIEQTPSVFSALKTGGKRQYELARAGEAVEPKQRKVTIYELCLGEQLSRSSYLIQVTCSRGTYVRTLVNDIGVACASPAHMGFLLRTQNGAFSIDSALTLEEIGQAHGEGRVRELLVSAETALAFLPAAHAPDNRKAPFLNGLSTSAKFVSLERGCAEDEPLRLYCGGEFLGVGALTEQELKLLVRLG